MGLTSIRLGLRFPLRPRSAQWRSCMCQQGPVLPDFLLIAEGADKLVGESLSLIVTLNAVKTVLSRPLTQLLGMDAQQT
jgi:hypothetical protein